MRPSVATAFFLTTSILRDGRAIVIHVGNVCVRADGWLT